MSAPANCRFCLRAGKCGCCAPLLQATWLPFVANDPHHSGPGASPGYHHGANAIYYSLLPLRELSAHREAPPMCLGLATQSLLHWRQGARGGPRRAVPDGHAHQRSLPRLLRARAAQRQLSLLQRGQVARAALRHAAPERHTHWSSRPQLMRAPVAPHRLSLLRRRRDARAGPRYAAPQERADLRLLPQLLRAPTAHRQAALKELARSILPPGRLGMSTYAKSSYLIVTCTGLQQGPRALCSYQTPLDQPQFLVTRGGSDPTG